MAFSVKVVLDSISPNNKRLTTFLVEMPRRVLEEFLTHRVLDRNTSSSRAIPFRRMAQKLEADPYIPEWGKNGSGMQAKEALEADARVEASGIWIAASYAMLGYAEELHDLGCHKQDVNSLLLPFAWARVVTTGTEWANYFALRCHEEAMPAFRFTARAMYIAYRRSQPKRLDYGQWHLPFADGEDCRQFKYPLPQQVSASRCARTSYETFDGRRSTVEDDLKLWEKLVGQVPKHSSPLGHQGRPAESDEFVFHPERQSNLKGWVQFRKLLPQENIERFEPSEDEVKGWDIPESVFT